MKNQIIDCFFYCGEESMLELRLETLAPLVDKFLILESPRSHSRIPRELEYPKQKDRFAKFKDKIIYIATDYCVNEEALMNDWTGRDVIADILKNEIRISINDYILSGDLDEIISIDKLKDILDNDKEIIRPYTFMMDNRILCFDLQPIVQPGKFPGTMLLKGKHLIDNRLCWLRQIRQNPTLDGVKYDYFNIVQNGGQHFSYCSGLDRTLDKFKFYSHHNETEGWTKDKDGLINCIKNKHGFTPNQDKWGQVEWKEENFPEYVYKNPHLFKEQLSLNY